MSLHSPLDRISSTGSGYNIGGRAIDRDASVFIIRDFYEVRFG